VTSRPAADAVLHRSDVADIGPDERITNVDTTPCTTRRPAEGETP
jgi:hypothetical protein